MIKRWFLPAFAAFVLLAASPAFALKVIDADRFYIYFPEGAEPLAARIAQWCDPMASFLADQGIPVRKPIHILLDDEQDQPTPITQLYPHREIRLPMRAPGALEDGYTERDPWRYYLFKGLCALGIYNERSGLPGGAYRFFGEIISPNIILPEWTIDGISHLLWELYSLRRKTDPVADAIFTSCAIPSLDRVSHHPEIWPGQFSYRIYGRPFVRWLYERYGWDKVLLFLQLHGRGIIPIEIDIKAKRVFGMTWNQLWRLFQTEHQVIAQDVKGAPIVGYWNKPYFFWNETGVYPGVVLPGTRSRYGFMDEQNWLWLSEYANGTSRISMQRRGTVRNIARKHLWDPGPGSVAVTRNGTVPILVIFGERSGPGLLDGPDEMVPIQHKIKGPPGVIQMSGPVMDEQGRIAVAGNMDGNWDIWLFEAKWYRVSSGPSIEIDPWWIDGKLVFASNTTGRFQIHGSDLTQLTLSSSAAMLPRNGTFIFLDTAGWRREVIEKSQISPLLIADFKSPEAYRQKPEQNNHVKEYSAWKSLWPNHIVPDYFFNIDDMQLGLSTKASDVSRNYAWNAGFRLDADEGDVSWRLGYHAKSLSTRVTRYPFTSSPQRGALVDEMRLEVNLSWSPLKLEELTLAANWRQHSPEDSNDVTQEEWWASAAWKNTLGSIHTTINLDVFNDGSQSLYGELLYRFGGRINTIMRLQGGKTWAEINPGHNTFRIGGNTGEGEFTQRASRLFSLRGFDSGIVEDKQAATASLDIQWPFAKLQTGYKTLPLFLHNITLDTFIDAGFASTDFSSDELLVSAGIELITGMQLAWDNKSHFSVGVAWPIKKPDDIVQDGPVFLILIGRPL